MDNFIPLYIQIKNTLLDHIDSGELLPGEKIPSEREMAATYGVHRQTIRSAIDLLVEEGIMYKVPYKGTFVAKQRKKPSWGTLDGVHEKFGFSSFLQAQGYKITSKVIIAEKINSLRFIQSRLNLYDNEAVYCLARIRYCDDEPFSYEIAYLPYKYVEGIEEYDFANISLYDFMDTKNHQPCTFRRSLIVTNPSYKVEKLLKIKNQPVYSFEYIGYDKQGLVTEYTQSYMRTDIGVYRFKI